MLCCAYGFENLPGVPSNCIYDRNFYEPKILSVNTNTMWYYQNQLITELPADCVGFVYCITNTTNGRMYIGKKLAKFKTTRYKMHTQKNGKKVRKRIRGAVASDWQDYYGSSDALNEDISLLGKDKFRREILHYCRSKVECNYMEAREQFDRRVLESSVYYNGHIRVRVHGKTLVKQ
jgi:hypothetical protein